MNARSRSAFSQRASFLICAAVQFFAFTLLAMLFYPGGARYAPASNHYLFFHNFFSDLGATHTESGRSNLLSLSFFVAGLVTAGLALVGFSSSWKMIAAHNGRAVRWGAASQLCLTLSGICYVGIALTPWNIFLAAHNDFVKAAFSLLLGFVFCTIFVQIPNRWPWIYTSFNLLYFALLAIYVFILFDGPKLSTPGGLEFQVVAQKIIVYFSILNVAFQAFGIRQAAGHHFISSETN